MVTHRPVGRGAVIAYRAAVHGLAGAASSPADVLLDAGVQDYPTGASARPALRLRGHDGGGVLVHGVRAATHLHHAGDLGLLAGALRIEDGNDPARQSIGPFGPEAGAGFGAALDEVAGAMAAVMSDGVARTKGELSGAVTPQVDQRLTPWCDGCGVHHVHDALFRYASLQAGLTIEVETSRRWRFLPPAGYERTDTDAARAELVRRFLRLAGPASPARLADWLALTPAAARRWWGLIAAEIEPVEVDGRRLWAGVVDSALLSDPPTPDRLRLLGPYDPLTETADRELTVPGAAERRQVWAAAANPGVVVRAGEIAGIWRRKSTRGRLTLAVSPFGSLPDGWERAVAADAETIADTAGANDVQVVLAA